MTQNSDEKAFVYPIEHFEQLFETVEDDLSLKLYMLFFLCEQYNLNISILHVAVGWSFTMLIQGKAHDAGKKRKVYTDFNVLVQDALEIIKVILKESTKVVAK